MKIEKILFPTKFRHLSLNALEQIVPLRDVGLKEVILCYIISRDDVGFVPFGGYLKEEEERLRAEARIRFEDWLQFLGKEGIGSKIVIEVGDPIPKLITVAEEEKVDLIVAGKKKVTNLEGIFLGSDTVEIMRRSTVPVLVSKYMVEFEYNGERVMRRNDRIFERPLLATDWSAPSERALQTVTFLKKVVKDVMVVHVIGTKISKNLDAAGLQRLERESEERLGSYARILQDAGIKAEAHLAAGGTVEEIIRLSRDLDASMIIMGTSGKDRLRDMLRGSVAHRTAELSELPTMVVP